MLIRLTALALACALPVTAQGLQEMADRLSRGTVPVVLYHWTPDRVEVASAGRGFDGPVRTDDRFAIASVSKLYLAVALLRLAERGAVDLDAPVAAYLPPDMVQDFGGLKGVTLSMLLGMRSGLPDYLDDGFMDDVLARRHSEPRRAALAIAAEEEPLFAPGTDFDYSNTNYLLAEIAMERVTGQHMSRTFAAEIFAPARLVATVHHGPGAMPDVPGREASSGVGPRDVAGYYAQTGFADGGLIATAADVAAFYRALFLDRALLSQQSLAQLLHDPLGVDYGLGVEVEDDAALGRVLGHSGGDLGFVSDVRMTLDPPAIAVALIADGDAEADVTYTILERGD